MENNIKKWFSIIFCAMLIITMGLCFAKPAASFSESENRVLAQMPKFEIASVISGKFMEDIEAFSTDQFPMRSVIVSINSHIEKLLMKKDSNGVFFADDDYLIEKPATTDFKIATNNFNAIKKMSEVIDCKASVMLVPTAYEVLSHKLPNGAYSPIQNDVSALGEQILSNSNATFINPTQLLKEHKDEYIYFKTDHHQTAYGSYLSYKHLCDELGIVAYEESDFVKKDMSEMFYGTMWSKAPLFSIKPDTISIYEPKFEIDFLVNYVAENKTTNSFYETEWLNKKDKYSMYFDGNHPLINISSSNKNGKTLAVFKDSYANSILPLLANHYEKIYVIDLRYYNTNPIDYLEQNNVDDVLVLYNTANFMTDTNLVKLSAFIK